MACFVLKRILLAILFSVLYDLKISRVNLCSSKEIIMTVNEQKR